MTKRNEKTSKKVASKAGILMTRIDECIHGLNEAMMVISDTKDVLEAAKSVAASALTQKEK